jgi:hypothetical protein
MKTVVSVGCYMAEIKPGKPMIDLEKMDEGIRAHAKMLGLPRSQYVILLHPDDFAAFSKEEIEKYGVGVSEDAFRGVATAINKDLLPGPKSGVES